MKYLVFAIALILGVPVLAILLKQFKWMRMAVVPGLIFLTVKTQDINFVSMEWYRGTAKGFEISLVDLLMLAAWGCLLLQQRIRFQWPPGTWLFVLYFAGSALSLINSADRLVSAFELFKMLRMYLLFYVAYHWLQDPQQIKPVLKAIAIAMLYIFYEMLNQKYRMGMWQARGPFPHQNSLVMYVNLFNSLLFAYVLNQKRSSLWQSLFWLGMVCVGILCTVFTFSRGGLMFLGLALMLVLLASLSPKQINMRKIGVLSIALLAGALIAWKSADSITERFESAPEESMEVRGVLAIAALKMVHDNPLGVGLNNWGIKINPPYPYGDHIPRKEVLEPDEDEEKGGLVETVYLMIAAECGWHTLAVYLVFIWGFCFRAFRLFFQTRDPLIKSLSLGLGAGLISIYLESGFEWVLKQSNNFYQLMFVFGLILALEKINQRMLKPKTRPGSASTKQTMVAAYKPSLTQV